MDRKLMAYLPPYLQKIREIGESINAQQIQTEQLWDCIEAAWNNQFIDTLDDYGCSRWEAMLGIHNKDTYTLEERRAKILGKAIEQRPFTIRKLKQMLDQLCGANGYEMTLIAEEYKLKIKLELSNKNMFTDVQDLIERIIPANLVSDISIRYNQYFVLKRFTYGELKARTYNQIRTEVFQ